MGLEVTPKFMSSMIATNVESERNLLVRVLPLFLKNIALKTAFLLVGERKCCLSLSNLGQVKVPEVMKKYIMRFDFILGVQAAAPYNCGMLSYKDTLYINFIRNTRQPQLEAAFFKVLQELELDVEVSSNGSWRCQ